MASVVSPHVPKLNPLSLVICGKSSLCTGVKKPNSFLNSLEQSDRELAECFTV